jgi:hypothetical protein
MILVSDEEAAQVERLKYSLSQSCKENLVERLGPARSRSVSRNFLRSFRHGLLEGSLDLTASFGILDPIRQGMSAQQDQDLIHGFLAPARIFPMAVKEIGKFEHELEPRFRQHVFPFAVL